MINTDFNVFSFFRQLVIICKYVFVIAAAATFMIVAEAVVKRWFIKRYL